MFWHFDYDHINHIDHHNHNHTYPMLARKLHYRWGARSTLQQYNYNHIINNDNSYNDDNDWSGLDDKPKHGGELLAEHGETGLGSRRAALPSCRRFSGQAFQQKRI